MCFGLLHRNSRYLSKMVGKRVLEKVSDTLQVKNFQDKYVLLLNAVIQDGCRKWWESDYCEKLPMHFADNLRVKASLSSKVKLRSQHHAAYIHLGNNIPSKFQLPTPYGFSES